MIVHQSGWISIRGKPLGRVHLSCIHSNKKAISDKHRLPSVLLSSLEAYITGIASWRWNKTLYSRFHRPQVAPLMLATQQASFLSISAWNWDRYLSILLGSNTKMRGWKPKIIVLGQKLWRIANSGGLRWWGSDMRGGNRASGQHMRWKGIPGNLVTHFFLVFFL